MNLSQSTADPTMADQFSKGDRSRLMSRVRNKDTRPELEVRSLLHRAGYRFRLHVSELPGSPDLVFPRYRVAMFVHGCFWHGHDCPRGSRPATNTEFWNAKIDANQRRDREARGTLEDQGWSVLTIWECELRDPESLMARLTPFFDARE